MPKERHLRYMLREVLHDKITGFVANIQIHAVWHLSLFISKLYRSGDNVAGANRLFHSKTVIKGVPICVALI